MKSTSLPFIFATDLHGIEQDKRAVRTFLNAAKVLDPDRKAVRIFGGDLWNFAALRRQADEDEKSIRLREDFNAGMAFLDEYDPNVLILGNHDQRLWDAVERERVKKSGPLAELAEGYIELFDAFVKARGIKVLHYDKGTGAYRLGVLAFAHGFGSGATITERMADAYGHVVFGHAHKITRAAVMKGKRPAVGYGIGSLARTDMEYVRSDLSALRQQHGFAYGDAESPTVFQPEIVNGRVLVATQTKLV